MSDTGNDASNPYASPDAPMGQGGARPVSAAKTKLARLSWQVPLAGLGLSILIGIVAKPIAMVGGVLFIGSVVVGFGLSLVGLVSAFKYSRVAGPSVCGLILNTLLALAIVSMFDAISRARDASIKASEMRQAKDR